MTSKVIIRLGEESEHVDPENLIKRGNYTFAKDHTVVFANVDVYYVIITDEEYINRLVNDLENDHHTVDEMQQECDEMVRAMIREYIDNNFEEFTQRIEKAIKTAHGVGVKKATKRVVNAANRFEQAKGRATRQRTDVS